MREVDGAWMMDTTACCGVFLTTCPLSEAHHGTAALSTAPRGHLRKGIGRYTRGGAR
jgi:hypothetical protein